MKDLLKYSKLWRNKRDELNINADPDNDWLDMQQALNKHLPQTPGTNAPSTPPDFFKAGPIAGFSAIAIVATYLVVHFAGSKINKQQRPDSTNAKQDTMVIVNPNTQTLNEKADSLKPGAITGSPILDSTGHTSSTINKVTDKALGNSNQALGVNKLQSGVNHHQVVRGYRTNNGINPQVARGVPYVANNTGSKANGRPGKTGIGNHQPTGTNNAVQLDSIKNILPAGSVGDTTQHQQNALDKQVDINTRKKQQGLNDSAGVKKADTLSSIGQININNVVDGLAKFLIARTKDDIKLAMAAEKNKNSNKDKRKKMTNSNDSSSIRSSRLDWGILAGVNTSGSFMPKSQNSNIYGSFPIDAYLGLFGTYHFNPKWGINVQLQALNPQKISGGYSHANGSKVDSGKIIQVTDERKAWFVSVPIHVAYKITDNLSLKAGPVINIPVKQISISNSLTPTTIKKDTVYYKKVTGQINAARYDQKINIGLSGGVGLEFGRFNIDATYFKSLSGYNVISDFGNYKVNSGSLQFTVGFKFNKPKP
jgi:hypothetical protein